jgi:hypothetical protein
MSASTTKLAFAGIFWASALLTACQEVVPTASEGELFPIEPRTIEVLFPFESFGQTVQVIGGYGSPAELGVGPVATDFEGLDSRALVRFSAYPTVATVRDTAGVSRPDSSLTFIGGRIVILYDTLTSQVETPLRVAAGATTVPWHGLTASWSLSVDTIGNRTAWPEAGGGPIEPLGESVADLLQGDSIVIPIDSAQVASWGDTLDSSRGMILQAVDTGRRLDVEAVRLRVAAIPSINPDTIVEVTAIGLDITFLFDPLPDPPPDGIRVGGAPAWRTFLTVQPPRFVDVPVAICEELACPIEITADRVNQAEIILTSRAVPPAFQPTDTTGIDVRAVIAPELLPKAPLGGALAGSLGRPVPPEYFSTAVGSQLVLPVTTFMRDLLRGETSSGEPPPDMLALLAIFEPVSLGFQSFDGPGTPGAPMLRLVMTISGTVELP